MNEVPMLVLPLTAQASDPLPLAPSLIAAIADHLAKSTAAGHATGGITSGKVAITANVGSVLVREHTSSDELRTSSEDVFAVTIVIECRHASEEEAGELEKQVYRVLKPRPNFRFEGGYTNRIIPDTEVRHMEEPRRGRGEKPIWRAERRYNVRVFRNK